MDFSNLWKHSISYRLTHASFHKVQMHVTYRYQHVTVPLHYLPRCLRSRHMQQNSYYHIFKGTFEDLFPSCYCYAIKTNSTTIRSRLSQPVPAGKGAEMSELQAHHCMTPRTPTRGAGGSMPRDGTFRGVRHFWWKEGIANGLSRVNLKLDLG